jgi:hypothetical protein
MQTLYSSIREFQGLPIARTRPPILFAIGSTIGALELGRPGRVNRSPWSSSNRIVLLKGMLGWLWRSLRQRCRSDPCPAM